MARAIECFKSRINIAEDIYNRIKDEVPNMGSFDDIDKNEMAQAMSEVSSLCNDVFSKLEPEDRRGLDIGHLKKNFLNALTLSSVYWLVNKDLYFNMLKSFVDNVRLVVNKIYVLNSSKDESTQV